MGLRLLRLLQIRLNRVARYPISNLYIRIPLEVAVLTILLFLRLPGVSASPREVPV